MNNNARRPMMANITITDTQIMFKNFAGVERQYNPPGKRNFSVMLDEALAQQLYAEGWNIKWLESRDPEEAPRPFLRVELNFNVPLGGGIQPPVVVLVKDNVKRTLDEETVHILDWAEIESVDITIRPYTGGQTFQWPAPGRPGVRGVKGFVKQLFAKIRVDELEAKYRHIPEEVAYAEDPLDGD